MAIDPAAEIADVKDHVLQSVEEQIRDLQPGLDRQIEIAVVVADLGRLKLVLGGFPADATVSKMLADVIQQVTDIQSGKATLSGFGGVLVELYSLQEALNSKVQEWLKQQQATAADEEKLEGLLLNLISRVRLILNYRPDVGAILDDLTAIKSLRGGPADAVAFHDFHVLQLAFESVWMHAFDDNLKTAAKKLYEQTVRLYDDAGIVMPPVDAIE